MEDSEKSPQEKQRDKTLKLIEKDQIENSLGKSDLDEELEDSTEDKPSESPWTEEKAEGAEIAPLSKAGSEEISREAVDPRFSKEHPIDEETLRKNKQKNASSGS